MMAEIREQDQFKPRLMILTSHRSIIGQFFHSNSTCKQLPTCLAGANRSQQSARYGRAGLVSPREHDRCSAGKASIKFMH